MEAFSYKQVENGLGTFFEKALSRNYRFDRGGGTGTLLEALDRAGGGTFKLLANINAMGAAELLNREHGHECLDVVRGPSQHPPRL